MILAVAGTAMAAGQGIDLNKSVIEVNGTAIPYGTYYKRMEGLSGFGRRVGDNFVPASPGFLTLQQMINEILMVQLAADKGATPTQKEVDDEYAALLATSPEQVTAMLKYGTTEADIRQQIIVQLSEYKLQTMGINIGDQQVESFYKEHPSMYTTPRALDLYAIAVETPEQQDAVDKKLNANAPFADVAKELSLDLTAAISGYLGRRIEANLDERLLKQVQGLKEGETSAWIDADARKYKYYVAKVYPEKLAPLTPELRKAVRQRLMIDRGRIKNDLNAWMKEKRKNLKLNFKGTPFDDDIKQAFLSGS